MIEVHGEINEQGRLVIDEPAAFGMWLRNNAKKRIVMSLKVKRRTRSLPQNSYYWPVVVKMVKDAMNSFGNDFTAEEVHEFLKKEFNYEESELRDGYFVKVPKSTTRLDTFDFNQYKERIQQFAAEVLGIYIPDPNEQFDTSKFISNAG